jgi:hypothetical protein
MTRELVEQWRQALYMVPIEGEATDPVTGATLAFSWYCDGVTWDGMGDRLSVILNNGAGAYRELGWTAEGLAATDVAGVVERAVAVLLAEALTQLEAERFADLVGEEL